MMKKRLYTLKTLAKFLNDHHMRYCAGFYTRLGRQFGARVRNGVLEVFDFDEWQPLTDLNIWDLNGQDITYDFRTALGHETVSWRGGDAEAALRKAAL